MPLAAAELQYRKNYYRLNAAALLEDLFFDALGSYINRVEPTLTFNRAQLGEKEWDYAIEDTKYSHKVIHTVSDVGIDWDATHTEPVWSAEHPIAIFLGSGDPRRPRMGLAPNLSRPVSFASTNARLRNKSRVGIGVWAGQQSLEIIYSSSHDEVSLGLREALPFKAAWPRIAEQIAKGSGANDVEIVFCERVAKSAPPFATELSLESKYLRPGLYLLPKQTLQDIQVKKNNRGRQIPKETVRSLLQQAVINGTFAPASLWFGVYASDVPPDLFITQSQEYESLFSPRRPG